MHSLAGHKQIIIQAKENALNKFKIEITKEKKPNNV